MFRRLVQMYKMAVWSADGRMYMPLYGYNDEVVAYGTAQQALDQFNTDYMGVGTK